MIRKFSADLSTYSNGILIVLILFSFLGMTALISRSRRETTGKLLAMESPAPSDWRRVPETLAGSHPGPAGRELDRLLGLYRTAAALLPASAVLEVMPREEVGSKRRRIHRKGFRQVIARIIYRAVTIRVTVEDFP